MSQSGPLNILNSGDTVTSATGVSPILVNGVSGVAETGAITISIASGGDVVSITATAPITANGVSGTPEGGTVTVALTTPVSAAYGGTGAATLTGVLIGNGTSAVTGNAITQHDVLVGGASNAITSVSPSTSGFVLTSNGVGSDPSFQAASPSGAVTTLDGNSGSASPSAGVITISGGSTGLTTSASASTMNLTGTLILANGGTSASLTASNGGIFYSTATTGAILAGTATARQMLQSGSSTTPAWSTATYPAATTVNQILYSSSSNVIAGLATAVQGVLTTGTGGIPVITSLAANGQLIIGSTAGAPAAATLTAGVGISIVNGSNSITIAAAGSEMVWTDEAISFNAAAGNGYFVTAAATATLPASPTQGTEIAFAVDNDAAILTIQANTGQIIRVGTAVSASAGTGVSNKNGDSIWLIFRSSDNSWIAVGAPQGTWTIT